MQVVPRASDLPTHNRPVSVALGIFDGVHLGHQALLAVARTAARQRQGLALALTFDRHPKAVVAPDRSPPLIQNLDHRLATLASLHLDAALVLPFNDSFSRLPARRFIQDLARDLGSLATICVGRGFTFGHHRTGDVTLLQTLGRELHFETQPVDPVCLDGCPISSTRIRDRIRCGDFAAVQRMLGRPYSLAARVLPGDRRGRELGFPTANLDLKDLVTPPPGVYAAWSIVDGQRYAAVLNLGRRPTLGLAEPPLSLEVHLLDFTGDLYDRQLEVRFEAWLRGEQRFDSLESLRQQISQDVTRTRALLGP